MSEYLSGGASVLNFSIKIAQTVYELKAVSEQAKDLLRTTKSLTQDLQTAKELRHAKSQQLSPSVKRWIDNVIESSETAVKTVADLVEDIRVDMDINRKKVGGQRNKSADAVNLSTRATFLLVDSPKIMERLQRLTVASAGLYQALGTLSSSHTPYDTTGGGLQRNKTIRPTLVAQSPPTYVESEFWHRKGTRSIRKAATKAESPFRTETLDDKSSAERTFISEIELKVNNTEKTLPLISFEEILPSPPLPEQKVETLKTFANPGKQITDEQLYSSRWPSLLSKLPPSPLERGTGVPRLPPKPSEYATGEKLVLPTFEQSFPTTSHTFYLPLRHHYSWSSDDPSLFSPTPTPSTHHSVPPPEPEQICSPPQREYVPYDTLTSVHVPNIRTSVDSRRNQGTADGLELHYSPSYHSETTPSDTPTFGRAESGMPNNQQQKYRQQHQHQYQQQQHYHQQQQHQQTYHQQPRHTDEPITSFPFHVPPPRPNISPRVVPPYPLPMPLVPRSPDYSMLRPYT